MQRISNAGLWDIFETCVGPSVIYDTIDITIFACDNLNYCYISVSIWINYFLYIYYKCTTIVKTWIKTSRSELRTRYVVRDKCTGIAQYSVAKFCKSFIIKMWTTPFYLHLYVTLSKLFYGRIINWIMKFNIIDVFHFQVPTYY